ncbi:MAG: hypothetical protein D8M59_12565 [Planctomycetes bacterium]|nr:hypothetical protein [Planctomycetota bacterium]NOG53645.1 hypothetical protein [Planctomycetota bacterium]
MESLAVLNFGILAAVVIASFCILAVVSRRVGVSRACFITAVLIGALFGPTIAGRFQPTLYERFVTGGSAQRHALQDLEDAHRSDRLTLLSTGVSPVALDELTQQHERELAQAEQTYQRAVASHALPRVMFIVFACMAAIGLHIPGKRLFRRGGSWHNASFLCAWMTVTTAGLIALAASFFFSIPLVPAAILGLTYTVASSSRCKQHRAPEGSPGADDDVAVDAVSATVDRCGAICWLLCLAVGVWCTLRLLPDLDAPQQPNAQALLPAAGIVGAVVGCVVGCLAQRWSSRVSTIAACLAITMTLVSIDLYYFGVWGPVLLALLVSGDARWFGAAGGARLLGSPWKPAFRYTLRLTNAASLQAAVGILCLTSQMLNDHLLLAAVFGAVMCDLTMPLRRLMTTYPLSPDPIDPSSSNPDSTTTHETDDHSNERGNL